MERRVVIEHQEIEYVARIDFLNDGQILGTLRLTSSCDPDEARIEARQELRSWPREGRK